MASSIAVAACLLLWSRSVAAMEGRAWAGSRARLPDDEVPFPEDALDELLDRTSRSAVLFSGGGSRAFAAALGQLAALRALGALPRVRYIGGTSGGAWAAGSYSFRSPAIDEGDFLGPVVAPENLTVAGLGTAHADAAAAFPARFPRALLHGLENLTWRESVADGWIGCAWEIFLEPAGVPRDAVPTWSAATEAAARRRGGAALDGARFARVADPGRQPFPLLGLSVWGPVESLPQWPDHHVPRVVAASPLYVGSPAATSVDYGNGTVAYGGFVEPHVWGCALAPAGDGLVATADAPAPRGCGLRVEDAIGISSWFAGGALASFRRLPEFANAHLGVERAAYAGGRSRRMLFSDGGSAENLHLSGALQRGCDRIVMFMNFEAPLALDYDPVLDPATEAVVQDDLPAFFGVNLTRTPFGAREASRAFDLGQNQFFPAADYARVVSALQASARAGGGGVATLDHVTVDNAAYGVRAGFRATITWVYLGPSPAWAARLPPAVAPLAAGDFPNYATSDTALSLVQTQLLHALVASVVLANADQFADLARGRA